jgi:uncharacterized protein
MNLNNSFEIKKYDFNSNLFNEFQNLHYAKDFWPIVYILSDGLINEAYVGETTDTYARMSAHLKNNKKNKLTAVHLITSDKFNKSATLDIEANLIKYISGDGQYRLANGNIGLANHNYYQKKALYWDIFLRIWDNLRADGIAQHSVEYINNSDLFKYSPYKSLNKEQVLSLRTILNNLLNSDLKTTVVDGGAGTGKTILAIFLFKLLNSDLEDFNFKEFGEEETAFIDLIGKLKKQFPKPKMALVVPMSSFRKTLKKVFKNIKGLSLNMVVGPSEIVDNRFDIIVVDESHRLRRRVNLTNFFSFDVACEKLNLDKYNCSELDWVLMQSDNVILFYDKTQSIKPTDVKKEHFEKLMLQKTTKVEFLKSQFRVKGGNDYVEYIDGLLNCSLNPRSKIFNTPEYEFVLFESIEDMIREIRLREEESGLSRLIAGYSWEWVSKKHNNKPDISVGDVQLKWNSTSDDWINLPNSINEVGCIHTTQGYDLNYAGVIFGNEITYHEETNDIAILKENYFDKNGKNSITDISELKTFIINIYKTMMLRGIKGTYVYVCDKALRKYFSKYILPYKTDRHAKVLRSGNVIPFENAIPIYNLKAAAGNFSENQSINENISDFEWVELPRGYKSSKDLFACTVFGESMNKIIPNGSICLFRKYFGGSREGKIVLVEHSNIQDQDFGSGYTVKEYHSKKNITEDEWNHQSITLKPLSTNPEYKEIEITQDELAQLKVIGIFEMVL